MQTETDCLAWVQVVGFFESGELPPNAQVIMVLSRLLNFNERDRERLAKQTAPQSPASNKYIPTFWSK